MSYSTSVFVVSSVVLTLFIH